jgi:hypothetical protein
MLISIDLRSVKAIQDLRFGPRGESRNPETRSPKR